MTKTSPLRESELVQMLAHEPELLAIADALVETQDEPRSHGAKGRNWKPVLLAAVVTAALAGASVAIAAGFGAFNGISVAQEAQVGSNILPSAVLSQIADMNARTAQLNAQMANNPHAFQIPQLLPDTARVIGTMPDGSKVYGLTDTKGDLCTLGEVGGGCGPPLNSSRPITAGFANASPTIGGELIGSGVAIDGVTSVSFTVGEKEVTVPVKNNVWTYKAQNSHATGADCIMAHFADGTSVNPFPEVPCP